MFLAFEGLHNNIKFVIIGYTQQKLFKGNDQQGECEQTIAEGINTSNHYQYAWLDSYIVYQLLTFLTEHGSRGNYFILAIFWFIGLFGF